MKMTIAIGVAVVVRRASTCSLLIEQLTHLTLRSIVLWLWLLAQLVLVLLFLYIKKKVA